MRSPRVRHESISPIAASARPTPQADFVDSLISIRELGAPPESDRIAAGAYAEVRLS
jgi:hypothetical protein